MPSWAAFRQVLRDAAKAVVLVLVCAATGDGSAADTAGRSPRVRRHLSVAETESRVPCLYNGYLLTVDPAKALSASSVADRTTLYVLNAVLIDPSSGRIVATFPALGTPAYPGGPVAKPVSSFAALRSLETPPAPGITAKELASYWRQAGVKPELLDATGWLDLQGAVATAGLVDTHFHVTSWSKKMPRPGERFGFWADLSDASYYINPGTWTRKCAREALWRIVADANRHLVETGQSAILLHGYVYGEVDSSPSGQQQPAYMFSSTSSCAPATANPGYLPNRVGAKVVSVPTDACTSDPGTWPDLDYPTVPALLVHTSGQVCWFNTALLAAYNQDQERIGTIFEPVTLPSVTSAGAADGATWVIQVPSGTTGDQLLSASLPYPLDVVVTRIGQPGTLTVPFDVFARSDTQRTLTAQAMIPEVASSALAGTASALQARPFYRRIAECIEKATWDSAQEYWGITPSNDTIGYGSWDPRRPYETNWYNGAKRGLTQYVFDPAAQAWRPTGFAEHYPMRDALAAVVIPTATVADLIGHRRNVAAWCHRHGLTLVNDIMFYRRNNGGGELESYESLAFDHSGDSAFFSRVGLDPAVPTGHFDLRVGVYYYIENGDDVDETLQLAHSTAGGSDVDRLEPPAGHREHPGWVRWLGWKLQLDGAPGTRNSCSSAPFAKNRVTDPLPTVDDAGKAVTFNDHSYGLLTMTDLQEQVLSSRESAALYWLVRESDPTSGFHNAQIGHDWSFLAKGVVGFLGQSPSASTLAAEIGKLSHVQLTSAQASQLAAKLTDMLAQVNDAYENTLSAIIRIWFERSRSPVGLPSMPSQVVCHVTGDGAGDLWARAIKQLRDDVSTLPQRWQDLPKRWQEVVPQDADLTAVRRTFEGERFRMEHLIFISSYLLDDIKGSSGLDATTTPMTRNVLVSTQPGVLVLDGGTGSGFPIAQELWDMPHSTTDPWRGLPARPRFHHWMPLGTYLERDLPFTINTDPPAMRDPRPALTLLGAVARTPIEVDPSHWADQTGPEPIFRPPDYLAGKAYAPFGWATGRPTNPMQITIEQALAAMTFWGAYAAHMEDEAGALATPPPSGQPGWFADIVVWRVNPLAIKGSGGLTLEALATTPAGTADAARLDTINALIQRFLPATTIVGGKVVYQRP